MNKNELLIIWSKTSGRCHFCGEKLKFEKYGKNKFIKGNWTLDPVLPKNRGGKNSIENLLPACGKCNGLRWHRMGSELRRALDYGITALQEIRKNDKLGQGIQSHYNLRNRARTKRRNR